MDVLSFEERQGLTICGDAISVQVRDKDWNNGEVVLYVRATPRPNGEIELPPNDIAKLRALLDEAERRGQLSDVWKNQR